jgi:hypothetical protein
LRSTDVSGRLRVVARGRNERRFLRQPHAYRFRRRVRPTITYGGEFCEDQQRGRDNATPDGKRGGVPDATGRFYGAFIEADFALDLRRAGLLTFILGVRWDKFHTEARGEPETPSSGPAEGRHTK